MSKKKKHVNNFKNYKKKDCHVGFCEVYPNLFIGAKKDVDDIILSMTDILVPLDSIDGHIWDTGWRGEILYVPVKDYGVLPSDLEDLLVKNIVERIKDGKSVAIFCLGGHGRTGYIASLVLGELGVYDPIGYIRTVYCEYAIESYSQVKAIASYLDKPEFLEKYFIDEKTIFTDWGLYNYGYYGSTYGHKSEYKSYKSDNKTNTKRESCKNCGHCSTIYDGCLFGKCEVIQKTVGLSDKSCDSFVDILSY